MKKLILFIVAIAFLSGCSNSDNAKNIVANSSASMKISGMTCEEMCAKRIEDKVARTPGVKSCEVNFENETATLFYDDNKVELNGSVSMMEEMSDEKYSVSDIKTEKIKNSNSQVNSAGGEETGQIMSVPSFELPNLADYFRNLI